MRLAHMIVKDFHSVEEADHAAAFDRTPADIATEEVRSGTLASGPAPSRSESVRPVKSGALTMDRDRFTALTLGLARGAVRTLRGGTKWKRIHGV